MIQTRKHTISNSAAQDFEKSLIELLLSENNPIHLLGKIKQLNVGLSDSIKRNEIPILIDEIIYAYALPGVFDQPTFKDEKRAKFIKEFIEFDFNIFNRFKFTKYNLFNKNIDKLLSFEKDSYGYKLILSYCKKVLDEISNSKENI